MLLCNYYVFWPFVFFIRSYHALESSGIFFKRIGKHEIVYPKVTRGFGPRVRRDIRQDHAENDSMDIIVNRWIISLHLNNDVLISPNYVAQWIHSAVNKKPTYGKNSKRLDKCLALHGTVRDVQNSSAMLTLCDDEVFGLVTVDGKSYFLQPLGLDGGHALYQTKIPDKLPSTFDGSSNWKVYDSTMDNHVGNDVNPGTETNGNTCMALEIGKRGEKYTPVQPFLCPGAYGQRRYRRQAKKSENKYGNPDDRPYRIVQSCFDKRRDKRTLTICDTAEYYNMTSDVAKPDYIDAFPWISSKLWSSKDNLSDSTLDDDVADVSGETELESDGIYHGRNIRQISNLPSRRPVLRVTLRWAKIIVGVDYDVVRFHGTRTQQYVFSMFNIVSSLFKQISPNILLKIVVMKMMLYENPQDSAVYAGDTKYPLYSVNMWNRNLWEHAHEKHDMAVWYTHFRITEDISTSPGAFMCQQQWSCLLIEDVGWLSAIKIAHGIGHLIGLTHDGDLLANNNCAQESLLKTTIMAQYIPANMPVPVWSECSQREYSESIRKYSCLERPPISYEHTTFMAGTFSLNDQCRIEFGDGWIFCNRISVPDPCKELWCNKAVGKRRSCMTRQTATLEGTACGRGKRCINHTCENAKRPDLNAPGIIATPSYASYPSAEYTTQRPPARPHFPPGKPPAHAPPYPPTKLSQGLGRPQYPQPPSYYPPENQNDSYLHSTSRPHQTGSNSTGHPSSYSSTAYPVSTRRPTDSYPSQGSYPNQGPVNSGSYPSSYPSAGTYQPQPPNNYPMNDQSMGTSRPALGPVNNYPFSIDPNISPQSAPEQIVNAFDAYTQGQYASGQPQAGMQSAYGSPPAPNPHQNQQSYGRRSDAKKNKRPSTFPWSSESDVADFLE